MSSLAINTVVGVILFVLGIFVGVILVLLVMLAYVESRRATKEKQVPSPPVHGAVFEMPITLDAECVVEVGMMQAIREEAKRIGRLN